MEYPEKIVACRYVSDRAYTFTAVRGYPGYYQGPVVGGLNRHLINKHWDTPMTEDGRSLHPYSLSFVAAHDTYDLYALELPLRVEDER